MTSQRWDLIVVGAGIAGLTAATLARQSGKRVLVYEARERVGGRARTFEVPGGVIDMGATWFWSNEPLVASLTAQLGLRTFEQHIAGDALFDANGTEIQRLTGNPIDVPALRFVDGAQQLARQLSNHLSPESLRLEQSVTGVLVNDGGVEVETKDGVSYSDQLIIAIPPALAVENITFAPPLPAELRSAADTMMVWMGQMVKAVAVYDEPFWRSEGLAGAAMSYAGSFREFHDHSGPEGTPPAIFGFAPAERFADSDEREIAKVFRSELVRLFGARAKQTREIHVVDWSRESFTSPRRPSALRSTASYGARIFHTPLLGRVHWATTETATDFAGHLEGAILAGAAAAKAVIAA